MSASNAGRGAPSSGQRATQTGHRLLKRRPPGSRDRRTARKVDFS